MKQEDFGALATIHASTETQRLLVEPHWDVMSDQLSKMVTIAGTLPLGQQDFALSVALINAHALVSQRRKSQ